MKRIFVLFFLFNASMLYAQNFTSHGIANMEVISREDYIQAHKNRDVLKIKEKRKGKKAKRIFDSFLASSYGQKFLDGYVYGDEVYEYLSYLPLPPDNKNKLLSVIEGIPYMRSYLLRENNEVDSVEMFGYGTLYSNLIYYSAELKDCDNGVWCKWYDVSEGKVKLLAELRDESFNYFIPLLDGLHSFFMDVKGQYYLIITNILDENKCFYYRITLAPQKADEQ